MQFNPVDIIRKKRDGQTLTNSEINVFIQNAVAKKIPDYQISSWLMAVFFQGLSVQETHALTSSMIQSGESIQFNTKSSAPKIDKHSTGGVGDKVSIILAPLVASCGVDVPMVSGRGLGHTGGTLDKLESIPGFNVNLSIDEFKSVLNKIGLAMMGQTQNFVPADKLLYALRDVTATVESIPLITASILSKKIAEGISGLVLDIKTGSGAFMKNQKDAEKLARWLIQVGQKFNLNIRALITDMNQPLGFAIGHSLEILECIDVLAGQGPQDLKTLTTELAAHMLVLANKVSSLSAARILARKSLQDGSALKKFQALCQAQGCLSDIVQNRSLLKVSSENFILTSEKKGWVQKIDPFLLGQWLIKMGGGRTKVSDNIDASVGFVLSVKVGDAVNEQQPLMKVYYSSNKLNDLGLSIDQFKAELKKCFALTPKRSNIKKITLIKKCING